MLFYWWWGFLMTKLFCNYFFYCFWPNSPLHLIYRFITLFFSFRSRQLLINWQAFIVWVIHNYPCNIVMKSSNRCYPGLPLSLIFQIGHPRQSDYGPAFRTNWLIMFWTIIYQVSYRPSVYPLPSCRIDLKRNKPSGGRSYTLRSCTVSINFSR